MTSQLLRGLLDDASLFPPASLAMPAAVAAHRRHQVAWYSALCGPFVCAETRLADLRTALTAANCAALAAAAGYVEIPLRAIADQATAGHLLATVDSHGYRPKLRTGGVTAEAFPDEATLAGCLTAVIDRRTPFKCTAGLHHAVRHTAADTGLPHHGFLNVLLAVAAAAQGASTEEVADLLAKRDAATVAARVAALDDDAIADSRYLFISFGTCSTDEPVADLVALGLLTRS